ncbi:ABC transporter permease [Geobacter sp. SVR]|uniref:ABC transporter permease n=1 Tax=Geobacter sp. SVR TaxID=2495594 RepID=UPI00143EF517|nr:ABC transporter permease [Geobacter sp. SVR]BCS53209.1 ABC transporter permease [Geobacter sp. SVR]GCF84594.1 peptide ABC transporter permease [Geobacter sp. SVR]
MNNLSLSFAYLRHKTLSTALTIVTFAAGVAMIVVLLLVNAQLQSDFSNNLKGIDLVVGGKGSPMQLILSSVFYLDIPTGNIPLDEAEKLGKHPLISEAIPLSLGDNYRGFRIVGTTPAYPGHYQARLKPGGRYWHKEMEAVLGAEAAARSGLRPGDSFAGSHGLTSGGEVHAEFPYTVTGILEPTGTVVDRLILTGLESVWHIHEHHHHDEDHDEDHDEHHAEEAHHHDDDHDHHDADEHEGKREITSLLVSYNSPLAAAELPRMINGTTSMQAASPAFEVARLTSFMGTGTETLTFFAWFLIALAGLGIFAGLYNAMNERRYDLALMRGFGAKPGKLFALMMTESLAVSLISAAVGLVAGHLLVGGIAAWLEHTKHLHMTGRLFLAEEAWLLPLCLVVGAAAALLPAVQVYRIDIFKTLVQR